MDRFARDIKQTFASAGRESWFHGSGGPYDRARRRRNSGGLLGRVRRSATTVALFEPDRLVRLWEVRPGGRTPIPTTALSGPTYRTWARASPVYKSRRVSRQRLHGDFPDTAQRLRGTRVTSSLFRVLRVSPLLGRFFSETDAEDGAAPTVVLGHSLWRGRFGSDPGVVGKPLAIDGVNHEIVGVAPPDFAFPEREAGLRDDRREITLYTPFAGRPTSGAKVIDYYDAIARLKPGATPMQAEAEGTSSLAASIARSRILSSEKAVRSKCASARGRRDDHAGSARAAGAGCGRRARPADRVRERLQPLSLARQRSHARAGGALGARCIAGARHEAAPDRGSCDLAARRDPGDPCGVGPDIGRARARAGRFPACG